MSFFGDYGSFFGMPDMDLDGDHDILDMTYHQQAIDADINSGPYSIGWQAPYGWTDCDDDDWYDFPDIGYDEPDYAWRKTEIEGYEFGVYPEDYASRAEYREALQKEKDSWRSKVEDGSEFGLNPRNFKTRKEYETKLAERKYAWRKEAESGDEFGIYPSDYESYPEFKEALIKAKNAWHKDVPGGSEFGLYPIDFDEQIEYEEALERAKHASSKFDLPTDVIQRIDHASWRRHAKNSVGIRPEDYKYKCEYDYAVAEAYKRRDNEKKAASRERVFDDKTYVYCKVAPYYPDKPYYYYFYSGLELKPGDFVTVPLGKDNTETLGVIVALGECLGSDLPCPVEKIKQVIRKES